MKKKNLPIGIHTFSDLITQNYLYVDKTRDIYNLFARGGKYYEPYLSSGKVITLLGIGIDPGQRNITAYLPEQLTR